MSDSAVDAHLVRRFYAHMLSVFDARLLDKRSAGDMRVVAGLLRAMGIVERDEFLQRYATTIGHRIYVPFEPGTPSGDWSLWKQMTVLVYECEHVHQWDRLGSLRFSWQYLTSRASRARLEAEAYRSQMEMEWWRYRRLLDPRSLAALLVHYGVEDADVKVAEVALRASAEAVRRGAVINRSSARAIRWLDDQAPELKRS